MTAFAGDGGTWAVAFAEVVVRHFRRHRQVSGPERGGQLFARFDRVLVVEEATGPRSEDRATRTTYVPDRAAEVAEILDRHARGLHFVGDWHTHPEATPAPSRRDLKSVEDCFRRSTHHLSAFLLVIAGTSEGQDGLWVSVHDETGFTRLRPM